MQQKKPKSRRAKQNNRVAFRFISTNTGMQGRKSLPQIAALMAPLTSSLRWQPPCRQCGNFCMGHTLRRKRSFRPSQEKLHTEWGYKTIKITLKR